MQMRKVNVLLLNRKEGTMKKVVLAILGVMLVCLSMCVMLPTFAGTWRDDFEDKDTREWEIFNLNRRHERWGIDNNEAVGEIFHVEFWSLWLTGDLKWEHYSVSCRAKLVKERNDPPAVGLTLHDRGAARSRYVFYIDYILGVARIEKWVFNGGVAEIPFVGEKDVWYDLTATVYKSGTLEFRINDVVLTVFDPEPLPGGQAGLVVSNARARFDNVEITGDNIPNGGPGKPFAVAAQSKLATTWGKLKMQ